MSVYDTLRLQDVSKLLADIVLFKEKLQDLVKLCAKQGMLHELRAIYMEVSLLSNNGGWKNLVKIKQKTFLIDKFQRD